MPWIVNAVEHAVEYRKSAGSCSCHDKCAKTRRKTSFQPMAEAKPQGGIHRHTVQRSIPEEGCKDETQKDVSSGQTMLTGR